MRRRHIVLDLIFGKSFENHYLSVAYYLNHKKKNADLTILLQQRAKKRIFQTQQESLEVDRRRTNLHVMIFLNLSYADLFCRRLY